MIDTNKKYLYSHNIVIKGCENKDINIKLK